MTLDDLLCQFESPTDAAEIGGLGRTAAYHWFAKDERRVLPSHRVIVKWANHFGLNDSQLGSVIRNREHLRDELCEFFKTQRAEKVEVKKTEAIERRKKKREERLNKRKELLQDKKDIEIERQVELEEKEHYLLEQEKQTKLAKMVAMLEDNLK
mgnify:CR=1 FL=1